MKKYLMIAAAAIVAFSACSKTETTYVGGENEIVLRSIQNNLTKANPTTAPLTTESMGVYAYSSNSQGTYFENTSFKRRDTDGLWAAATPLFYPKEGTLDFTVYAPYANQAITVDHENIICHVNETTDFLYGAQIYTASKDHAEKALPVTLKHAKAKIMFNIESMTDNVYTINKIELIDVLTTSTVNVNYKNSQPTLKWTQSADDKVKNVAIIEGGADVKVTTKRTAFAPNQVVYLIPSNKTQIKVTYKVANTVGEQTFTKEFNPSEKWEAGKKYTYNLIFTTDEILFNPMEEEWQEGEINSDVEIKPVA